MDLFEREFKDFGRVFRSPTEQGAMAYRSGRFQQAIPFFEQGLQAEARPDRAVLYWLWLTLAKQRLAKAEEARRWLEGAAPGGAPGRHGRAPPHRGNV